MKNITKKLDELYRNEENKHRVSKKKIGSQTE